MPLGKPFVSASPELQELYAEAKRLQWRADDLDWDTYALTLEPGIPSATARDHRARWTGFFMQVAELMVATSGRLAAGWDDVDAQLVLAVQAHDYARHLEVWRRYLERLNASAPVVPGLQLCLENLRDAPVRGPATALLVLVYEVSLAALYGTFGRDDPCELRRHLVARLEPDVRRHMQVGGVLLSTLSLRERHAALADVEPRAREFWRTVREELAPSPPGLWPTADTLARAAKRAEELRGKYGPDREV